MITIKDIERAKKNIGQFIHRTPLIPSNSLSFLSGADVYLNGLLQGAGRVQQAR
jgi:threonine dehydratase